ncbi:HEPN-associated N-terminal domain-containing protein [uncultured Sphingomonas sp.]|uniref:HEPN-associated N-terminal domain-containing protein n=1 Tax=uncultured Sphingomonas sp. TaxID=158754 RepID=UPI0025E36E11|nr:HEPN-associated N-terminal domain-containing protein [uncultured Sphingomonas sp.]
MSYWSERMIEMTNQRLRLDDVGGKRVCSDCFADEHIAKVVRANAKGNFCDYCGRKGKKVVAADLSDVLEFMLPQIDLEYDRADQALPNDPDTGERMFPEDEFDARDMLETHIELELPNDHDCDLMEDIANAMPDHQWCRRDPLAASRDEAIGVSWAGFKQVIKHRRRFFFLQHKDRDLDRDLSWGEAAYGIPELLERIAEFTQRLGMIRVLPAGSAFIRAQRMNEGEQDFDAARMGPPPYAFATMPNRMSPIGVPMFYGAVEASTALAEIATAPGRFALGTFVTTRQVVIVDLSSLPPVPSLFDPDLARYRAIAMFMHEFIGDFKKPIDRQAGPHLEYLPTQVITEYFRTIASAEKKPIEGLAYSSTKDGKPAIVLFAENRDVQGGEEVLGEEEPWLRMDHYEEVDHVPPE